MSFGSMHLESMKANRPDLYRELKDRGELPAVRDEAQDRATIRLFREAEAREQHLNRVHPDRNGFLNRVQAMTEAQNVVMRQIVLVPILDADRTSNGSTLPQ